MSTDYGNLRVGRLVLKGEKPKKAKKHKKQKKERDHVKDGKQARIDEDIQNHGGWWEARTIAEMRGTVALEFDERTYVKALDNGSLILGAKHGQGEPPDPEEIFSAFVCDEKKVSFKSGYGKYMSAEFLNEVTGRSVAVGLFEQFEPVFENDKMALLTHFGTFMGFDAKDDAIIAESKVATENNTLKIRCNMPRESNESNDVPTEQTGNLKEIEKNYVKKFQKFQDKKLKLNPSAVKDLITAKKEGSLHAAFLNRRSQMKSDRYCK